MSEKIVEKGEWANNLIPSSWSWANFAHIFENVSDSQRKVKQKNYIKDGRFPVIDQGEEFVAGYDDDESLLLPAKPPFLIFGDHTRCVKYVDFSFIQGADGIKVLSPFGIDPKYAYWALCTLRLPNKGYSRHYRFLRESEFPIAPSTEQRRIVAKLEELLSDLDAGVAALERVRANLRRYRASVLKAAVEGRLTEVWRAENPPKEPASELLARILKERRRRWEEQQLATYKAKGKKPPKGWEKKYKEPVEPDTTNFPELPKGWQWATMEQLSDETRSITYGVVKLGDPTEGGVPTLRSSNVRSLHLDLDNVKSISRSIADKYSRTYLEGGEILLTIRGTLGGVIAAPPTCVGFNISREVAMIALLEKRVGAAVSLFVASPTLQNWITRNTRGIAYTGINIQTLKEMPVPLPTLDEAREIVDEVERRLSVVQEAEAQITVSTKRASRLRQSILKRAFEGKLVPQDPSDEPASKLLKRIRYHHSCAKIPASRRKKKVQKR